MATSLGDILDSILGYRQIIEENGFKEDGLGDLSWSHRYINEKGDALEFNASGWVLYDASGAEPHIGRTHQQLREHFLQTKTKEELILLLMASKQ